MTMILAESKLKQIVFLFLSNPVLNIVFDLISVCPVYHLVSIDETMMLK